MSILNSTALRKIIIIVTIIGIVIKKWLTHITATFVCDSNNNSSSVQRLFSEEEVHEIASGSHHP